MAQSNRQQVEALSEISDIIVQISDEDLGRMESLGEQITRFDQELGHRILDACSLLIQLNDEVESALERLEPDVDEEEVDEEIEDEDSEAAEAEIDETDIEDEEDEGDERGRPRSKRKK